MEIIRSKGGYYYKVYKNGKKKRISRKDYLKKRSEQVKKKKLIGSGSLCGKNEDINETNSTESKPLLVENTSMNTNSSSSSRRSSRRSRRSSSSSSSSTSINSNYSRNSNTNMSASVKLHHNLLVPNRSLENHYKLIRDINSGASGKVEEIVITKKLQLDNGNVLNVGEIIAIKYVKGSDYESGEHNSDFKTDTTELQKEYKLL